MSGSAWINRALVFNARRTGLTTSQAQRRKPDHDRLEADVQAFMARGGVVDLLPSVELPQRGRAGWDGVLL